MSNLVTTYTRRISKIVNGVPELPKIIVGEEGNETVLYLPGSNHVDNPDAWNDNTIYRGELALDLTKGKVYTSDDHGIIEFGAQDMIINGMQVYGAPGVIKVSPGKVRINGRIFEWTAEDAKKTFTVHRAGFNSVFARVVIEGETQYLEICIAQTKKRTNALLPFSILLGIVLKKNIYQREEEEDDEDHEEEIELEEEEIEDPEDDED